MNASEDYSRYLQGRSRLGLAYRNHWLYPRLNRWLRGRVLDVGCGIGDMLRFLPSSIGVDVNPVNVSLCRDAGLVAEVMAPDVLPFDNGSFDSVILDNVLEHIEEPGPLLAEIRRVLVDGGVFVVGVPGERGYAADADHKQFYDRVRLEKTIVEAGFVLDRLRGMPFNCDALSPRMTQFCIYGAFRRA